MGTDVVPESLEGSSEEVHVKMAGAPPGVRVGEGFLHSGPQPL